MILERGDMWSVFGNTDIFIITTNPIEKNDGSIVMGRGIALEAKQRFPELPYEFGKTLRRCGNNYVGLIGDFEDQRIYYFMVKDHWANPARLDIIKESVDTLHYFFGDSTIRVDLNFPGIGNGGLNREEVLPLLMKLQDNVHIWEKD